MGVTVQYAEKVILRVLCCRCARGDDTKVLGVVRVSTRTHTLVWPHKTFTTPAGVWVWAMVDEHQTRVDAEARVIERRAYRVDEGRSRPVSRGWIELRHPDHPMSLPATLDAMCRCPGGWRRDVSTEDVLAWTHAALAGGPNYVVLG